MVRMLVGLSLSEHHTDEMYIRDRMCMFASNGIKHTVNPNDRYKMQCVTIASKTLLICFNLNVSVQPVWILVRENKWHLRTNNKDCSKEEGLIGNEDPHEKTTTAKGITRGLTRGDKQHWSFQNNDKQDCSKEERRIREGKQWTLRSKDRQEKSKRA